MTTYEVQDTVDITASAQEAAEITRRDLNFLGMLAAPEEFTMLFPPWYIALFVLLTEFKERVSRYAIGIPRGFAKTTFLKLLCLWYILFSHKQFILIVGAAEGLAANTLADVCDFLSSPNIVRLFGNWRLNIEVDTQTLKVFNFRGRNIVLRAIGAGTSVRGINRKNARPDVIIMDDIQKKEDAEGPNGAAQAKQLLTWILGTLGMTRSHKGCTYLYVGNMYPENCILAMLKANSQWTSFIVGGILEDGSSLWEELKPLDELLTEYQSLKELGAEDIFIAEILNSTDFRTRSGLDLRSIPPCPDYHLSVLSDAEASFILIDPSGSKKTSDDHTIEHFTVVDGKPILDEIVSGIFTPLEVIQKALALGIRRSTRLICVEAVAYQASLLFWFQHICNEAQITGFYFEPVSPKGRNKNVRIKTGLIKLIKGEMYLHPDVRGLVISQALDWNPLTLNNKDDIIDPLGYVEEVLKEYGPLTIRQIFDVSGEIVEASHTTDIALPF